MWYLNINSAADAKRMIRGKMGVVETGAPAKESDEDLEAWAAIIMAKKEARETAKSPTETGTADRKS